MKKTLYIAAAVVAVMFAASCQKDGVQAAKKGMTLSAIVDDNAKATITDKGDKSWSFSWETGDVVSVTSPSDGKLYDFTYDGKSFKNAEAEPAAGAWTAVYPKSYTTDGISFLHQDGTLKSAMEKYLLEGSCESEGSATLSMEMTPKFAILKITNKQTEDLWFSLGNKSKANHPSIYKEGIITPVTGAGVNNKINCEIGTVKVGQTNYYIVPASEYYLAYAKDNVNNITLGTNYNNSPKTFVAGKIYNVTF